MSTTRILSLAAGLSLASGAARAAVSFDDLFAGFGSAAEDQVEDFAQPLGDAATLLAGSGTFHGAGSQGIMGFDAGVKLVLTPLGSADIPTGSVLDQTEVSAIGVPMLVAGKGLVKGLQVGARFMSLEASEEVGKLGLLGASLRFEVNELFDVPVLMPRVGLQADWSRLTIGESLTTQALGLDLIVSKSFVVLEPYAGLSLIKGTTDLSYDSEALPGESVDLGLDTNIMRLAAGVTITPFPLLRINAEYALTGDFSTVTVGALISLF